MPRPTNLCNSNIDKMQRDVLYHLGILTESMDFKKAFGEVKFVIMGGSQKRMQKIAEILLKEFKVDIPVGTGLSNISWTTDRYVMYKVGPIISVSHGMGAPSISICLHEMTKLLHHAGATGVRFVRIGTSAGLGVKPGTVVITTDSMDCAFNDTFQLKVMGKVITHKAKPDGDFVNDLIETADAMELDFDVVSGKTMCSNDFYEEHGRMDGAICEFTDAQRKAFLQKAYDRGVRNLEMESLCFAAFCHRLQIKAAVICAAMIDRLVTERFTTPVETMRQWQERPHEILIAYMKKVLNTLQ